MIFSSLFYEQYNHCIARKSIGALEKTNLDLDGTLNELVLFEKGTYLF